MELKLTKSQYETLMMLVYLGNTVVNGFREKNPVMETDHLENYVYAKAADFGLGKITIYDEELDEFYPSAETEDSWLKIHDDYINDLFWDELMHRLAERDLENRYGRDAVEAMPAEERGRLERELMDKLYAEFHQNGLNNLILYRPS
ncbi:MAG: hypothetical protein PHF93_09785 [Acidobacteriota bacterium]|jgi:hypothetical protein|nr:hypothetical protein [Acidobacteriota bacterium]OQB56107.1 MAG: hypothetical protein BWX98_01902 [Candidatus Aminicenantes bacterium ADurb.Bin147]HNQ80988.1 hypothetical protein [Candidatus Aminicenantes bacterium]MDD8011413.1 hypothetical protein [Acidobacteriota bacterium]MDD8030233.1 hypothetical protein [Acidobacteriota bacterium]